MVSVEAIRPSAALRASSVMMFLETWRDKFPLMVAIADLSRSGEISLITTSKPASAATCAMPLPIWPEPITPTFLTVTVISSSTGTARALRARPPNLPSPDIDTGRSAVIRPVQSSLLSELGQCFREFRNRLVEIGNQAVIGDLEDRRVFILVDGDDHLGVLHAGEMLDRAGNADGDIKLRGHHLAGLADLPVVGRIAGIDRRARGADTGAELVGKRLDIFGKVLAALHGTPARDDDLGRRQFGAVAFRDFLAD